METLVIQDSQITASASDVNYEPPKGRLNSDLGGGAWCAAYDTTMYLQIDLLITHIITEVINNCLQKLK